MSTAVKHVNKKFGDVQALYDVDLNIQDGEFLAILGPSGCGKTTLLRLLAGFESLTDGAILLDDSEVANNKMVVPPEQRNVSMVFQSFALWPHMNVREHIQFPLRHHHFVDRALKGKMADRVNEVLRIVELEDFSDRMPNELSGGQKQRVSLARAIAPEPKLLLMDEPLSNLDAELRMEMRREIQALHQLTKASIVYVTHDQGEALAMADRIVVMNKGKIEQIGTPEEIYYYPKTPFVATFVGKANLFKGTWHQSSVFTLENSAVSWRDWGIPDEIKKENLYPLRPEQITLTNQTQDQMTGVIRSRQFQGKEYHYSVDVAGQTIIAHLPISKKMEIGEEVAIMPLV
ncbi:ABC transporter ATP-binding protein [Lentibacillus sp. CBA3610]|uniref:ABC transporter ATP-binding protein n=1 Tax=Lentibacillus sp. CBA3610 TaxID=2518176 RepID=UPI001596000D|nr:ABC transporter ATP-binding protein [Lentibacillus sp. CBA3610]QKY69333.1 ABC transporter ATP-binding protein [Lentibacillus sp. CBA3610]